MGTTLFGCPKISTPITATSTWEAEPMGCWVAGSLQGADTMGGGGSGAS